MIDLRSVGAEERLTRYLDERSKYSAVKKRVKFNAFTPPHANLSLSIYRTNELGDGEIWKLGDDYVAPHRGKPIIARADLSASEVFNRGLTVEPDTRPHERHGNIVNWPPQDQGSWLKLATELANAAELIVR